MGKHLKQTIGEKIDSKEILSCAMKIIKSSGVIKEIFVTKRVSFKIMNFKEKLTRTNIKL